MTLTATQTTIPTGAELLLVMNEGDNEFVVYTEVKSGVTFFTSVLHCLGEKMGSRTYLNLQAAMFDVASGLVSEYAGVEEDWITKAHIKRVFDPSFFVAA